MTTPLCLLLIEDNADDALLLEQALCDGGFAPNIHRVTKRPELEAALLAQSWPLIISDYRLPQFDGLAALRLVRAVDPDVPVLMVSGTMGEAFIVEAMRAGAQDFILKNHLVRLAPVVRRALQEAEGQRERRRVAQEQAITVELLRLINASTTTAELMRAALTFLQAQSGCEILAVRLRTEMEPHFESYSFPPEFVCVFDQPCASDEERARAHDDAGSSYSAGLCDMVLRGATGPDQPFFTAYGSFWTNSITDFVASMPRENCPQMRHRCHALGYQSLALIPLRAGAHILGLLQLADARRDVFTAASIAFWERIAGSLAVALAKIQAEEALRESEAQFRSIFDNAAVGIIQASPDGRVLMVNGVFCRLLGYRCEELLHQSILDFTHPDDRDANAGYIARAIAGEISDYQMEKRYLRKDGTVLWASVTVSEVYDADGHPHHAIAVIQDITARKAAEEDLRQSVRRFELLSRTAAQLLQNTNPQAEVESLCGQVMALLDCQCFFNFLVDEAAGRLHLNACAGIPADEARRIEWLDYGVAVCGCAARDGCRIVAEDIPNTPAPRTELVKSYGIRAYACHPLLGQGGTVLGTLSFGTRTRDTFSDDDLALMKAVTDQVAVAMIRMRDEQTVHVSEDRLKRAQEIAHLGSWELDLQHNVLIWSDEVYRIFGLQPQEFGATYEAFLAAVHPDDRAAVDAAYAGSLRDGRDSYEIEHRVVRAATGEIRVVHEKCTHIRDATGQIIRSIGMVHDITERKQADAALQERERLLQTVLETLPVGVAILGAHGEVLRVNSRYGAIWRGTADALPLPDSIESARAYRGWSADTGCEIAPEAWASSRAILHGDTSLNDVLTIQRFDGTEGTILNSAVPLRDVEGRVTGAVVAIQDITELHDLQEQERRMLFTVAHDLRAPATILNGHTELLLEALSTSPLVAELMPVIETVRRALRRMNTMVDNLTELTRLTSGQRVFQPVPLALVPFMTELLGQFAGVLDTARIETALPADLPGILADPHALERILLNLLLNAQKYSAPGTPMRVSAVVGDGTVAIAIADRGQGIPPEDLPRIFDRFYRAERGRQAEGIGLGLYITQELVAAQGGCIRAESREGEGSTFTFTLPVAE